MARRVNNYRAGESMAVPAIDRLVNLTAHNLHLPNGFTIPRATFPARAQERVYEAGEAEGVRLVYVQYDTVSGLPDPEPGVLYVVSQIVRQTCPERADLASPGEMVKDEHRRIIGTINLRVNEVTVFPHRKGHQRS
jgi:hypothetical protein